MKEELIESVVDRGSKEEGPEWRLDREVIQSGSHGIAHSHLSGDGEGEACQTGVQLGSL